ncbi:MULTISPECIES: hypothetical protein [Serratia]|nr:MULTISPECIES: hypothetical protein [Serratia]MBH2601763.1 hypothetical protein [Serratia marcescens]MBH2891686.1 hypothetical protein [Serratia marcescens]MBN5392341.1 hypothetical protein [Serratia marcescens]MCI2402668.1 hypothetical protein [Serratia sp. PGPR-27]MDT0207783.1 hypothetical protein [Serratia marcescens]
MLSSSSSELSKIVPLRISGRVGAAEKRANEGGDHPHRNGLSNAAFACCRSTGALRGGNRLQPLILVRFVNYLTKISQFHNQIVQIFNQAAIKYMQFLLNVQSKKSLIVRMMT